MQSWGRAPSHQAAAAGRRGRGDPSPDSGFTKRHALRLALVVATLVTACAERGVDDMLASARQSLHRGDTAAAVIELKSALQKQPDLAQARFLLGRALLAQGRNADAVLELRKALELEHPPAEAVPLLARAMVSQGRFEPAVAEFGSVRFDDAGATADLLATLALAYAGLDRPDGFDAAIATALSLQPNHGPARILKARMLAARGETAEAFALVDSVMAAQADSAEAWKARGDLLRASGDDDGALAAYRKVLELAPAPEARADAIGILLRKGDLDAARSQLEQLKASAPGHPQVRYVEALLATRQGDLPAARKAALDVVSVLPDHVGALDLAGRLSLRLGDPFQASIHLAKALQLAPYQLGTRRQLAEAHLRLGKPDDALQVLQPLLGRLADARSVALAAQAHLQSGDTRQAEAAFAKAVRLDPSDTSSQIALAIAAMDHGRVDEGIARLRELAASDAGIAADVALVAASLARGRAKEAFQALDALEAKVENKAAVAHMRGRALLLARDRAGARTSFERAVSLDPGFFPSVASLAALDEADRRVDDARRRFEAVLARQPQHVPALLALAELAVRSRGDLDAALGHVRQAVQARPDLAEPRVRLVEHHLATGDARQALNAAQEAVAALPGSAEALDALGRAQLAAGESEQAQRTLAQLVGLKPNVAMYHARLGEAHFALQKLGAARDSFRRALDIDPALLVARQRLVALELAARQPDEALRIAREHQRHSPASAAGFELEGDVLAQSRDAAAAIAAYRKALAVEPQTLVTIKLHLTLRTSDRTAEADTLAAEWRAAHPKDARFLFHLGNVASAGADFPAAETLFREVVSITPANYLAYNNIAWSMLMQKKRGALPFAEKAMQLKPGDPAITDTLAQVLALEGQFDRALELQAAAVRSSPDAHALRLNLAKLYLQAGRRDEALQQLDRLADLGEAYVGRREVMQLRQQIRGTTGSS